MTHAATTTGVKQSSITGLSTGFGAARVHQVQNSELEVSWPTDTNTLPKITGKYV